MTEHWTRRKWLQTGAAGLLTSGTFGATSQNPGSAQRNASKEPAPPRRLLYNYDAWGPFLKGHSMEAIHRNIDLFAGTQVTTVMLSPNAGQSVSYPSQVGDMCHSRPLSAEQRTILYKGMGEVFAKATEGVAELWQRQKVDAFGLLVQRALSRGMEVFGSFRMNDVHMAQMEDGKGPYTDQFYRDHPEWRVPGSWALNYGVAEVQQYRLAQLEELVRKYPLQGLELDFVRGVPYFASDLPQQAQLNMPSKATRSIPGFPRDLAENSVPVMTSFIRDVRKMTERVSRETGRKILLAVRVPSSLWGCRRVGLDTVAWHREKSLDFLTVAHFLHLFYDLPIDEFKSAMPGLSIYGCIDYIVGGPYINRYLYARDASAEIYRGAAAALLARGADGILLFNMYVSRGNDPDPKGKDWRHDEPLEVLREVRDLASLERKPKLYLVDYKWDLFDKPFYDVKAQLPQQTAPDLPLTVRICLGETQLSGKQLTLRVVAESLPAGSVVRIQINGVGQGASRAASQPLLFPEPYNQMPPEPSQCLDFLIRAEDVKFGLNEVAVLSSLPLIIQQIELSVILV